MGIQIDNPLGTQKVSSLLHRFALPSIVAMLVSSLYNIVDQFFIGHSVGELGNAATNISFPLSISCVAIALLFGIGGSSAFNISMGLGQTIAEEKKKAVYFMGNALFMMVFCGTVLLAVTQLFLQQLMVFGFQWGMAGAAWATVIGQMISGGLAVYFLCHCRTVTLCLSHLKPHAKYIGRITALGAAPCSNQLAMMIVQIVMNKSLKYYGSLSVYGESIPIACVGIITKVNQVFMAFVIGISQGLQPIVSFNYGAGLYRRVKAAYMRALSYGGTLAVVAFLLFQLLPHQIIALFGKGSPEYFQFAQNYFHIFLFFTFLNFLQPISSNFFTAIGKPTRGMILSLTRQILFLLPLIIIFPLFVGIDGIMYAGPVADLMAAIVAITLGWKELRRPEYQG